MNYRMSDLLMAERHVAQAEKHIIDQEHLLSALLMKGYPTAVAEELLQDFHDTLAQHRRHRDEIARALKE